MRQTAARVNRAWLIVIGLLVVLAGAAVVALGSGLLPGAIAGWTSPQPTGRVVSAAAGPVLDRTWVVVLIAAVGVVLGLLALAWLIAQIPRTNPAKPFRLHDDVRTGLTRCDPAVLARAVDAQVETLPGVRSAAAVIRGTADRPDLTVRVTAGVRTDLPGLLDLLHPGSPPTWARRWTPRCAGSAFRSRSTPCAAAPTRSPSEGAAWAAHTPTRRRAYLGDVPALLEGHRPADPRSTDDPVPARHLGPDGSSRSAALRGWSPRWPLSPSRLIRHPTPPDGPKSCRAGRTCSAGWPTASSYQCSSCSASSPCSGCWPVDAVLAWARWGSC